MGWLATIRMKLVTSFYRRAVLICRSLDTPQPGPALPEGFRLELVDSRHLRALCAFRPSVGPQVFEQRLYQGDVCHAVWRDDTIVHAAWIARETAFVQYLSCQLQLGSKDIYIYDSHTLPGFRLLGLASQRGRHVIEYYRERGFERALALIASENTTGLRATRGLGYELAGRLHALRLGPWIWTWNPRPHGPRKRARQVFDVDD